MRPALRQSAGRLLIAASLFLCGQAIPAASEQYVPIRPDLPAGTKCLIDPAVLHPTQAAVGMREVEMRTAQIKEWSASKRERFLQEKTAPNEAGRALKGPSELPKRILDLRDDPYRSLAWLVREQNGFKQVSVPYMEFLWGNFFRSRIRIEGGAEGYARALSAAMRICHSPEAKDLPGYIGH
jgi:hypothetical protein